MMRLLITCLALGLTSCTALRRDDAPGCSGPKRPANPYGSVLAPEAAQPAAVPGSCLGARP